MGSLSQDVEKNDTLSEDTWAIRVAEAMEVCKRAIPGTFLNSAGRELTNSLGSTEPIDGVGRAPP